MSDDTKTEVGKADHQAPESTESTDATLETMNIVDRVVEPIIFFSDRGRNLPSSVLLPITFDLSYRRPSQRCSVSFQDRLNNAVLKQSFSVIFWVHVMLFSSTNESVTLKQEVIAQATQEDENDA